MKSEQHLFIGLLLAFASLAPVSAQPLDSAFTVVGAYRFGGEVDVDASDAVYKAEDRPAYGLIWNTRHEANTQWEVYFSRQQTDVKLSDASQAEPPFAVDLHTLQLGGTYELNDKGVRPYVALTLGGTHAESETGSDTFLSGSIGLGIVLRPNERIGFRLEARVHGVLVRDSTELFCQSGPGENFCIADVQGDVFAQLETFAGVTFRF